MKLNDFRIRTKLLVAFVVIAMIAGAVGIIGKVNLTKLANSDKDLYDNSVVDLGLIVRITNDSQKNSGYNAVCDAFWKGEKRNRIRG